MARQCRLDAGSVTLTIDLLDTPTADAVWEALPLASNVSTWGKEIYFATPIDAALESDARDVIEAGEIAYWPPGTAIAVGFGRTPASQGDEIRLASECNVFGRTSDDVQVLDAVPAGSKVTLTAID